MKILIVDDDDSIRNGIAAFLNGEEHKTQLAENGSMAIEILATQKFDLIISDLQMPEVDGFELLTNIRKKNNPTPLIIITAFATIEKAVNAMQFGADDFLTKPLNLNELKIKIKKIEQRIELQNENRALRGRVDQYDFPNIIGESESMKKLKKNIRKIASDKNISVMIYGKSGTGKELAARNIHKMSERVKAPFVAINCAALPEDLLESELFGFSAGAFTGANKSKPGIISSAHMGTLFLDEVSEMSQRLQAKLLRVLQDHKIQPLGSNELIDVDVRIVGASNINLKELVDKGMFREDLFYRLNVVEIKIPELCERREDIPMLVNYFNNENHSNGMSMVKFNDEAMSLITSYRFPGNIRELQNLIKMLSVTCDNKIIQAEDLPLKFQQTSSHSVSPSKNYDESLDYHSQLTATIKNFDKEYISSHLKKNNNNISRTAESIGLSRVSLYKKIKEYDLNNS